MTPTRPIEIVGGGLAGLSLGRALRLSGVDVTVLESGDYPRHRVCGEFIAGLPARTRGVLQLDPLLRDASSNQTVGWFVHGRVVRTHRLPAPATSLSRFALDARLAEAFAAAGGNLVPNTRVPLATDAPGRVFATGRRRSPSRWLGLKIHARGLRLDQDLELHLGDNAYVGVTRIEQQRVNLCGLFRRRELAGKAPGLLLAYLAASGLDALAGRLAGSSLDDSSFSVVAALEFDAGVSRSRCVRLGDACAMIPPFTGHGMAMAFQSAEIAHGPLLAYARGDAEWPETRAVIDRALRRRFRLRLGTAHLLHPFLLHPSWQRWLTLLNRARLLPLRPLYAALH